MSAIWAALVGLDLRAYGEAVLRRLLPDPFVLWLLAIVAAATLLPVRGPAALWTEWLTYAAIFALFFLHGARLAREALIAGLIDWRLHLAILGITYGLFPLAALALGAAVPGLLPPLLWTGMLFLAALPSTVQSSIAYTSMAGGNVAGAVAAAALSNLIGVLLTPLLAGLMAGTQGATVPLDRIGSIFLILFLPFILGHALRPIVFPLIEPRPGIVRAVDRGTILLAVYGAFSAAIVDGLWSRLTPASAAALLLLCLVLLGIVLGGAYFAGRAAGLDRGGRIAVLFCGSVKSLASGVPMARILFPGAAAGAVLLPLMIFHTLQLIVCAWIAARLGDQNRPEVRRA